MILEIPSTNRAMPNIKTTKILAPIRYANAIRDIIITIMPRPMPMKRDFPDVTNPLITFSIPTKSKRKARK